MTLQTSARGRHAFNLVSGKHLQHWRTKQPGVLNARSLAGVASKEHLVHLTIAQALPAQELIPEGAVAKGHNHLLRAVLQPLPQLAYTLLQKQSSHVMAQQCSSCCGQHKIFILLLALHYKELAQSALTARTAVSCDRSGCCAGQWGSQALCTDTQCRAAAYRGLHLHLLLGLTPAKALVGYTVVAGLPPPQLLQLRHASSKLQPHQAGRELNEADACCEQWHERDTKGQAGCALSSASAKQAID